MTYSPFMKVFEQSVVACDAALTSNCGEYLACASERVRTIILRTTALRFVQCLVVVVAAM